jgi:hypothetical protein
MPETASKIASTMVAFVNPKRKGIEANIDKTTQTRVVNKKVFCISRPTCVPFEEAKARKPPLTMVTAADVAKTGQCPLSSPKSTIKGANIVKPRKITKIPITYPTGLISIMETPLIAVTVTVKSYKNYPRCTSVVN